MFVIRRAGARGGANNSGVRQEDLQRAADDLAVVVQQQWIAEASARALNQPEPIAISWSIERGVRTSRLAHPDSMHSGGEGMRLPKKGKLKDTLETFLRLPLRRMAVIGEPGSGKTSLAVMFTVEMLARRDKEQLPVPVIVNLSAWRPHRQDLTSWFVRRIEEEYRGLLNTKSYGTAVAARLVDSGMLLPVLDGLDEIPKDLQPAAIEGINRAASSGLPLLLTCRIEEFERAVNEAGHIVYGALVIRLEAVGAATARRYLSHIPPSQAERWGPLLDELLKRPTGIVAQALSTPLMVWLTRMVYTPPTRDPAELLDIRRFSGPDSIEDYLLDALMPTMYAPRAASRPWPAAGGDYSSGRALVWLTFLARYLDEQGTRDFAWWRLELAVPRRIMAALAAAPILLSVALAALTFASLPPLRPGAEIALLMAVLLGPPMALAVVLCGPPLLPTYLVRPASGQLRWSRTFAGIALGVGIGAVIVPTGGVLTATSAAGVFVVGAVFLGMLQSPKVVGANDPETTYLRDRAAMWTFVAVCAVGGALIGLAASPGGSYPAWLALSCGGATAFGCAMYLIAKSRRPGVRRVVQSLFGRRSQVAVLLGSLVGALAGWQLGQLTVQQVSGIATAVTGGTFYGIAIGLTVAFSGTASSWLVLSTAFLASKGVLPRSLLQFLDDARKRGLLRQAGGYYQFRHARLQDRLLHPRVGSQ